MPNVAGLAVVIQVTICTSFHRTWSGNDTHHSFPINGTINSAKSIRAPRVVQTIAVRARLRSALGILDVLGELVGLLAEHPRNVAIRQRLFEFLSRLSARPYAAEELASDAELSISYVSAPVFDQDGNVAYELQIGALGPAVTHVPSARSTSGKYVPPPQYWPHHVITRNPE
jgi:hypothetical protein